MDVTLIGVTISFFGLIGLLWAEQRADAGAPYAQRALWMTKPVASLGFLITAVSAGALAAPGFDYGTCVFVGLVLSALGDVLLIPQGRGPAFLGGIGSFLLGHVAYVVAFVAAGFDGSTAAVAGGAMLLPLLLVGRWLLPQVEGGFKAPVMAYMIVISAMVAVAVGAWRQSGDLRPLLAAVAFYVSDLSVARDRFVAPGFINRAWGLPLYYGAQTVFALSVRAAGLGG